MIIATGIDIVDIARLQNSIRQYGQHFLNRVYTDDEQRNAPRADRPKAEYFAGRWAAKEAIAKALGTGIGQFCAMTDMNIGNDHAGKPVLALTGTARETAEKMGIRHIHVSISHERAFAVAHAIAEG